jgi:hypothetical protein
MPQLPIVTRGRVGSIEALEPKPSTPPLPLEYSIGVRTRESMAQPPTIVVKRDSTISVEAPASASQTPSVPSTYPKTTAKTLETLPQLPDATVKRDRIGSVKASATISSTPPLSSKHEKITVRSIDYEGPELKPAKIAYMIDQRRSWHWLPYSDLVDEWGEDVIRKFHPRFR